MHNQGFAFYSGGLGVGTCSLDAAFVFATVGNHRQNCPDDCAMAVPLGSAARVVTFWGFKRCVTSFRAAGMALRDIPTCFRTCQKPFCVRQAQNGAILLRLFQKMTSVFRGRRSTSDMSRCVFFANPNVRAASSGDDVQIPLHTSRTILLALHTLHFTHHTLHSTLHRQQSTLHTWHLTLHTLHFALHTWRLTLYSLHCTLHALSLTLHSLHFTLQTLDFTLHTLHFTLFTWHSTLFYFTLYTPHSTLHTLHSTLCTLHF